MSEILNFIRFVLDLGGPVVGILVIASFVALTLVIYKIFQFYILDIGRTKDARRAIVLWQNGQTHEAINLIKQKRGLIAQSAYLVLNRLAVEIPADKETNNPA